MYLFTSTFHGQQLEAFWRLDKVISCTNFRSSFNLNPSPMYSKRQTGCQISTSGRSSRFCTILILGSILIFVNLLKKIAVMQLDRLNCTDFNQPKIFLIQESPWTFLVDRLIRKHIVGLKCVLKFLIKSVFLYPFFRV